MATVITVHGTYAHIVGPPGAPAPAELQWWQPGSRCEEHVRQLIDAEDNNLTFVPFEWSGENSERSRRKAGHELLALLGQLEDRKESYCLVAHSHGGSVIASALVESVAKGRQLDGLKKWITVGSPFVHLRKERYLFSRLTLPRKVVFVASLMLLMMFLFYLGGQILDGTLLGRRENQLWRFAFSATMMSLPFVFFYAFLRILDARRYYAYRPKLIEEATKRYADRWLPLNHEDDEAVQGLKLLPSVKISFFDRGFAVPMLTLVAIFVLPLAYLYVMTAPTLMVAIADVLKNRVYDVEEYRQADAAVDTARQQMSGLRRKLHQAREVAEKSGLDATRAESARRDADALRRQLSEMRKNLQQSHPQYPQVVRAQRFKRRFLEKNGQPCEGGKLCGGGHDYRLNSALLYHIVTDELASAVVDEDMRWGPFRGLLRLWVPTVLVPVVFAMLALGILMVIQFIAGHLSGGLSRGLNKLTRHEITRSALGNDTDGEIALGADSRPAWLSLVYPFLPGEVGNKITEHSNQISFQSIAKFRNAISTLAFADTEESKAGLITTYFTWQELIHTSYFEVPEFRTLLAYAIGQSEGFAMRGNFQADLDFKRVTAWHEALKPQPAA